MRFVITPRKKTDERKEKHVVVTRFIFIPKCLPNSDYKLEVRWLCFASFVRHYTWVYGGFEGPDYRHYDIQWFDQGPTVFDEEVFV